MGPRIGSWRSVPHRLAAAVLTPILLAQGRYVRRRTPRLPQAPGPREGTTGTGPPLRLLVVGDSAAAGVGAASQNEALTGQVVSRLASHFTVRWRLGAATGATTRRSIAWLQGAESVDADVVLSALGVNDVTGGVRSTEWLRQQRTLLDLYREKCGARFVVYSGLPPMGKFPALPQPLRWFLGNRARRFDAALRDWAETHPDCAFVKLDFAVDASHMAADGYHPGPAIYARWGDAIAKTILERAG